MPVIGAFVLASEKEWSRCGEQKQSAVTRPTKLQGNPAKRASLRNGVVMAVSCVVCFSVALKELTAPTSSVFCFLVFS